MVKNKNLHFLESLLASIDMSKPELAHLMRMSPQNIFAYFKRDDMRLSFVSRKDVAEKLGLNYTGVNRWFKVDDISISYIFKIAELYDLKVRTTIKPKSSIS